MIVARNLVRRRFLSAAASAAPSESGRDVTNAANAAQPNANNEQNNKSNAPLTNYEIREKMDEVFRRPVVRRKKKKKKKKKKNFFIDFFFFVLFEKKSLLCVGIELWAWRAHWRRAFTIIWTIVPTTKA
jgi:hypothetical protein